MKKLVSKSFRLVNKLRSMVSPYRKQSELDNVLVRDIGKYNISNPKGKFLFSYVPWFVSYLCQHPDVGVKGWNSTELPSILEKLAKEKTFSSHTMYWESAEVVRQIVERGYVVDCIYDRDAYLINDISDYDVIIDEWSNLPRWAAIKPKAKKLFYATGSHWIFHNHAELQRHKWLFARRAVDVPTGRQVPPILSPSVADLISSFGNKANNETYGNYSSKIRKLWISSVHIPMDFHPKKWKTARNHFLWFGGGGWVHKGLDLVVEAFLKEPNLRLSICGGGLDIDEGYFFKIYGEEIKKHGNIIYHGSLDPQGEEFGNLVDSACAVIYPSAAEGCSGAIVQCMQHGLIPLVSTFTGLDVHETWPSLEGSTDVDFIENIREGVHKISEMPEKELDYWRQYFWDYSHKNHTRAAYSRSLSKILDEIIKM